MNHWLTVLILNFCSLLFKIKGEMKGLLKQHHEASVPSLKPYASLSNSHVEIHHCKQTWIHVCMDAHVHGCKQNLVLFLLQHVVLLGFGWASSGDWGVLKLPIKPVLCGGQGSRSTT